MAERSKVPDCLFFCLTNANDNSDITIFESWPTSSDVELAAMPCDFHWLVFMV